MGTGDYICVTVRGGAPWGFSLCEGEGDAYRPLQVYQVEEGGRASLAGICEGDEVVSLNGEPSGDLSLPEAMALVDACVNCLQLLVKRSQPHRELYIAKSQDVAYYGEMESDTEAPRGTHLVRTQLCVPAPGQCIGPESQLLGGGGDGGRAGPQGGSFSPRAMVELQLSLAEHTLEDPVCTSLGSALGIEGEIQAREALQNKALLHTTTHSLYVCGPAREPLSQHGVLEITLQHPAVGRGSLRLVEGVGACGASGSVGGALGEEGAGQSQGDPASFIVSFGIPEEGAEPAEEPNSDSEKDLGIPNKHRARHARLRRSESLSDKQVKEAKSKCKRIAILLNADAPNPNNKGVLMFKRHRQRAKKYTLVSYGTGESEPEYEGDNSEEEEDYDEKDTRKIKFPLVATTSESELDEDFITNAQGGGRVITCDWDTGLLEIKRKLNSGEEMEQLPNTTGKGATMFAQRRHRMDEIAAEHEEMRRQGIPVEGVQEVEKHAAYQQMEERSYMQATTESQAYMDVNVHQKQQQQYQQYQEQQYYEQQQQYQQQQYNQQQQYQQQQQQYQQQQYQQQQQHHQQQEYQQQQQIQQYSYNMNGVANHHTNEMQSSMSNRTPQPFSVQNQVPAPFSSPVSGSIQEAMGKGEQIASRDERISTPAIKSGILQDTRNRFKGKPMFNFKQAPKVPPNPELMNLLNRSDKKLDFESGTEEDYLSLGAEACNFLQSPRVKHKTPPPVAPKPIINPNSPPWSPQPELSNQELPLHAENSVPAPAAASEPESAPAPELEPTPALAPEPSPPIASQEVPTNPPSLEKHTWSPPGSQAEQQPQQAPACGGNGPSPPQPHSQCEPQVSSKAPPQTQAQQQPPQQPPMSTWAPAEMKSQAPAPSQSPQQLPWVTPQPQAQPPMNYWAPAPAQSQPQWAQPQEQAQDQPPWVQPQEQVQQQPQPPWAQPQEQVQQQPQPPWTQPQEQVQQHPQPPWAQPQERVQQQPQPPWTQPQEQAQAQPPRVQPQEQVQQQPQPPWAQPQEQVQQQPQPPWTQPQEQAQAQPPQAQLQEQVQQQPQPPWAQPQEQVQQQSRPPWAQPQEQVQQQSRPPWAQPQEQVQQQPQPPWTQPQEQVQQQPQPPWAQPQEQVQQPPQPPWCQQHQPPQQAWPEAQTQAQPRPPWVSSPQPPMNAWTPPQSQAQPPQPPWAQPAQPPAQPQPPMNAWAQAPAQAQVQVQLPWAQQAQLPINAWTPDQNQAQPQSPWAQTTPTQSPPQQSWQLQPPQHAPSQPPMNAWAPAQAQPQTHTSMWAPQPQQAPVNTQTPMDRVAQPSPKPGNALQKAPRSTPPPRPQRINSYTLGERSSSPLINPMASVLIPVQGMGSALSMPAVTGKGADLFAKRQSRMEKYVVDSDTVLAATARENKARPTSPSPSVPHSWKYSPNCRAPPTSNYNPIQSPSYPPGAIKQPPPSSPAAKAKKGKGKPACKPLAVIDVMKHQPYQLNASLFTYGPAVEAAEAAKAAAPKPAPVPPNQNQPIRYEQLSPVQPAGPMNASYPQQAQQPNGMPPQPHMHDGPYHQVSPNAYQPPNNPYQQAPAGPYPQPYNPLYQQAPTAPYQPQPQAPNPSYQPTPQGPYQSAHSPPYQAAPQAPYQPLPPSTYVVPSFPIAAKPESISGGSTAPKPRFMAKKSSAQEFDRSYTVSPPAARVPSLGLRSSSGSPFPSYKPPAQASSAQAPPGRQTSWLGRSHKPPSPWEAAAHHPMGLVDEAFAFQNLQQAIAFNVRSAAQRKLLPEPPDEWKARVSYDPPRKTEGWNPNQRWNQRQSWGQNQVQNQGQSRVQSQSYSRVMPPFLSPTKSIALAPDGPTGYRSLPRQWQPQRSLTETNIGPSGVSHGYGRSLEGQQQPSYRSVYHTNWSWRR